MVGVPTPTPVVLLGIEEPTPRTHAIADGPPEWSTVPGFSMLFPLALWRTGLTSRVDMVVTGFAVGDLAGRWPLPVADLVRWA